MRNNFKIKIAPAKKATNLLSKALLVLTMCMWGVSGLTQESSRTITGTVINDTGDPVIGASVIVRGTTRGTTTGADGSYSIQAAASETLEFGFLGYLSQEAAVGARTAIDVTLQEDAQLLGEVVVIGYGTTTIRDLTSSVSSVKSDDLDRTAMASIDNMLQGRVSGLNMIANSAQPGAAIEVNIRGAISPNGNNQPLYVIDGVPMTNNSANISTTVGNGVASVMTGLDQSPLNTINPSDILSIDVLKDASAAAIYGSASANGVIIITTKRGREGSARLSYTGSHTIQVQKPYKQKLMDARTFMTEHNRWFHERQARTNNTYPYGPNDFNGDGAWNEADYTAAYNSVSDVYSAAQIAGAETFDWLDYVTDNAFMAEHNVSLNGGSNGTKYFASYNFYLNDGILKNSKMERNSLRLNLDQKLGKRISLGINFTYSLINTKNQSSGNSPVIGIGTASLVHTAYRMTPYILPEIDPATGAYQKGLDEQMTSPAGSLQIIDKNRNQRVFVNPTLTVDIATGLTFKAVGGFDSQVSRRDYYIPTIAGNYLAPEGMATIGNVESVNKSIEGYFNYDTTFGDHRISAVLGFGGYFSETRAALMQSADFWTDSFGTDNMTVGADNDKRYTGSSRSEITKLSQFARFNYTFKDRYILSLTSRRDGSSVFAANKKWGVFPSVSGAWRFSDEPFMEAARGWLSDLKLRVGYGSSGNEPRRANSLAVYGTSELTGAGTNIGYGLITDGGYLGGIQLASAANPDLSWETNETVNFGIDFGFRNQRVAGSVDYFVRTARDLLDYKTLPSNQPISSVIANIGSTQAKGVEFELNTRNIETNNFNWATSANFSYSIYRWKERNPELVLESWESTTDEMSAIFGWKTDGLFKSYDEINAYKNSRGELIQPQAVPGNIKYVDYNNDGKLDDGDNHYLGRRVAPFHFGLRNTFSYKNLAFSFYLYGSAGYSATQSGRGGALGGATAQANTYDNGIDHIWSMWNQDGDWPGIGENLTNNQRSGEDKNDDYFLRKTWFAKLGNIELSYSLPQRVVSKLNMSNIALVFNARNIATFTNYFGYDPEMRGNYPYPITSAFTFGVKLDF